MELNLAAQKRELNLLNKTVNTIQQEQAHQKTAYKNDLHSLQTDLINSEIKPIWRQIEKITRAAREEYKEDFKEFKQEMKDLIEGLLKR